MNEYANLYAEIVINRRSAALDRLFTYRVPPHLAGELEPGMLVSVPFHGQTLEGVVVRLHDVEPEGFTALDIADILHDRPLFSEELLRLSAWMSDYYLCTRAAALQAMLPAGMQLSGRAPRLYQRTYYALAPDWQQARPTPKRRQLIELLRNGEQPAERLLEAGFSAAFLRACGQAGLVVKEQRRLEDGNEALPTAPARLSDEQEQVLAAIRQEQAAANRPFLLHGVTGSGKTEVYLQLIRETAERGRQSILLVPEIALSVQMLDMLRARLELPVAVLHSGLKDTERRHIWQEIAEGRYPVVVGARSAVFAPLPRLGLIIIDEAHETSYKQDNNPRFHAVTVAEKRCGFCGASLLLGSATPGVEQAAAAVAEKRYAYGALRNRYHAAPLPEVEIVDLREELRQGNSSIFSRRLSDAIAATLARRDQAVLFLNRRGYYQHYSCRDCGLSLTCPHCAVAMSFHAEGKGGRLKCHYCGRSMTPPAACPTCGSSRIRRFGVGTQRVALELEKQFPQARVLRLDSDVTEERGRHEQIYRQMRAGEADILVGTQMVAKGLDFPNLTLAAVVAADTLLNLPDWRAGERTYQLITQLAGRAGRRDRQGLALIQTYTPDAPPIRCAAADDYRSFYLWEMENRRLHGFPPFTHLIRVLLTSQDRPACAETARALFHYLRRTLPDGAEVWGPAEAPLARIKDRWRRQLIVKWPEAEAAARGVEAARELLLQREKLPRDLQISVDVDPFGMM